MTILGNRKQTAITFMVVAVVPLTAAFVPCTNAPFFLPLRSRYDTPPALTTQTQRPVDSLGERPNALRVLYAPPASPFPPHSAMGSNDYDDGLQDDWETLKQSAGNVARKAGRKLKSIVEEGAEKLKTALVSANRPEAESFLREAIDEPEQTKPLRRRDIDNELFKTSGLSDLFMPERSIFATGSLLAETLGEQGQQVDAVLEAADRLLERDRTALSLLGSPMTMLPPFSQSTSSTTINGKTKNSVQASFEVRGPFGVGVASITSDGRNVEEVELQFGGQMYRLNAKGTGAAKVGWGRGRGNVIDAEVLGTK